MEASSTTPIEKAKPASEMTLMERPEALIRKNEPITQSGIAIPTMRVERVWRRKISKIPRANAPPNKRLTRTISTASRTYSVLSVTWVRNKPFSLSKPSFSSRMVSCTFSMTTNRLLPRSRWGPNAKAGSPSWRINVRISAWPKRA